VTSRTVNVQPAGAEERGLIEGMLQFYFYDFSEMEPADSDDMEFNADGAFGPYVHMAEYWSEASRHPLMIRVGERPVGFALLNNHSHRNGEIVERNMAEFFVARKHRRGGVATEAVRQILALYPGRWEIAVVERNAAAKAFWPRAIAAAPNVTALTRHEGDGDHWRGPIWSFVAGAKTPGEPMPNPKAAKA
jgi:predicted acetyltransferase